MALALTLGYDLEVEVRSVAQVVVFLTKVTRVSTELVLIATHEGVCVCASHRPRMLCFFISTSGIRLAADSRLDLSFSCEVGDVGVVSYSTPPR